MNVMNNIIGKSLLGGLPHMLMGTLSIPNSSSLRGRVRGYWRASQDSLDGGYFLLPWATSPPALLQQPLNPSLHLTHCLSQLQMSETWSAPSGNLTKLALVR